MDTNRLYNTTLTAALDFFGTLEGQSKMQFGQDWKKLTEADKAEIYAGLVANGYQITGAPTAS